MITEDGIIRFFVKAFIVVMCVVLIVTIVKNKKKSQVINLPDITVGQLVEKINSGITQAGFLNPIDATQYSEFDKNSNTYYYTVEDNLDIYIQVKESTDDNGLSNSVVQSSGISYRTGVITEDKTKQLFKGVIRAHDADISELELEDVIDKADDLTDSKIDGTVTKTKDYELKGLRFSKTIDPNNYTFYLIERVKADKK